MDFEGKCLAEEFGMLENGKEEQRRTVEQVTLEIQTLHKQAEQMVLGYAIEIGRRLVEVKAMLPHGAWGDYLKNKVNYSRSTANNFMRIFHAKQIFCNFINILLQISRRRCKITASY